MRERPQAPNEYRDVPPPAVAPATGSRLGTGAWLALVSLGAGALIAFAVLYPASEAQGASPRGASETEHDQATAAPVERAVAPAVLAEPESATDPVRPAWMDSAEVEDLSDEIGDLEAAFDEVLEAAERDAARMRESGAVLRRALGRVHEFQYDDASIVSGSALRSLLWTPVGARDQQRFNSGACAAALRGQLSCPHKLLTTETDRLCVTDAGKLDGPVVVLSDDMEPVLVGSFGDGQRKGRWFGFNAASVMYEILDYQDGQQHGLHVSCAIDKKPGRVSEFSKGVLVSEYERDLKSGKWSPSLPEKYRSLCQPTECRLQTARPEPRPW